MTQEISDGQMDTIDNEFYDLFKVIQAATNGDRVAQKTYRIISNAQRQRHRRLENIRNALNDDIATKKSN